MGIFPFASFFLVFSVSVIVILRLCTPGFFVSFVSFAIVSFAVAFSARFATFRGVRYSSVLLVWPFVDRTVGLFVLVSSVCCSEAGVV